MELKDGKVSLSVIVPCYNEQENIRELVERVIEVFNKHGIKGEIVLIDDGSTDSTKELIRGLSRQLAEVVGLAHRKNRGITEAWFTGVSQARGEYVATIDADLQYAPEDIWRLYEEIKNYRCDLVQGWRSQTKEKDASRRFLSSGFSLLLRIFFIHTLRDPKSGFVVYRKEALSVILQDRMKFKQTFQHFFLLSALKRGYACRQVPVVFYPRCRGRSFIKSPLLLSLRVLLDLPRAFLEYGPFIKTGVRSS
jgi:glycosyltransferase involved in cell wall biosynthesis